MYDDTTDVLGIWGLWDQHVGNSDRRFLCSSLLDSILQFLIRKNRSQKELITYRAEGRDPTVLSVPDSVRFALGCSSGT